MSLENRIQKLEREILAPARLTISQRAAELLSRLTKEEFREIAAMYKADGAKTASDLSANHQQRYMEIVRRHEH